MHSREESEKALDTGNVETTELENFQSVHNVITKEKMHAFFPTFENLLALIQLTENQNKADRINGFTLLYYPNLDKDLVIAENEEKSLSVFAGREFKKDDSIAVYDGELLWNEKSQKANDERFNTFAGNTYYIWQFQKPGKIFTAIDTGKQGSVGRFVKGALASSCNAKISYNAQDGLLYYTATKPIAFGEEITTLWDKRIKRKPLLLMNVLGKKQEEIQYQLNKACQSIAKIQSTANLIIKKQPESQLNISSKTKRRTPAFINQNLVGTQDNSLRMEQSLFPLAKEKRSYQKRLKKKEEDKKGQKHTDDTQNKITFNRVEQEQYTEWYDDEKMNTLMRHYFGNKIEQGVHYLPAQITITDDNSQLLIDGLNSLETSDPQPVRIVAPINLGNNHWVALYIDFDKENRKNPTIQYVDSLGAPLPEILQAAIDHLFPDAFVTDHQIPFQTDSYNCGVWTLKILTSFIETNTLPELDFDIAAYRSEHQDILISTLEFPVELDEEIAEKYFDNNTRASKKIKVDENLSFAPNVSIPILDDLSYIPILEDLLLGTDSYNGFELNQLILPVLTQQTSGGGAQ